MARSTAFFVLVLALSAGAVGGVAAGLAVGAAVTDSAPSASAPPPPAAAGALREEVALLREQVTRMHQELARLTSESQVNAERAAKLEAELADGETPPSPLGLTELGKDHTIQIGGRDGQVISLGGSSVRLGGRFGKTAELMKLTEEERWTKMRDDLALDSYQENELRQIQTDLQAEMRDMLQVDPDTGMPARMDFRKMMEARKKANDRVKNLLSEDQHKKLRDEGYAAALGLGGPSFSVVATSISTAGDDDK